MCEGVYSFHLPGSCDQGKELLISQEARDLDDYQFLKKISAHGINEQGIVGD
jgi:hypothetical protein